MRAASDIAKYIIYKYWQEGKNITNLKLQKILYYVQGYSFFCCNEPAYEEDIYRWPYGPVVPDVYFEYNRFRANSLPEPDNDEVTLITREMKRDTAFLSVVDSVVQASYRYDAGELVDKTHEEAPWKETKDSEIIKQSLIEKYFNAYDPLGIRRSL